MFFFIVITSTWCLLVQGLNYTSLSAFQRRRVSGQSAAADADGECVACMTAYTDGVSLLSLVRLNDMQLNGAMMQYQSILDSYQPYKIFLVWQRK